MLGKPSVRITGSYVLLLSVKGPRRKVFPCNPKRLVVYMLTSKPKICDSKTHLARAKLGRI